MRKRILFLTFSLFIATTFKVKADFPEQQFPCDKQNIMHQCSIWTDGYYAIKAKTYDWKEKFEIEDFIFKEIKEGIFDDGNIVIKDGIVKQCKKCNKKRKSDFLVHKYIVFNKIPNYNKYIKNNKIDNLEEFNKNGYFVAFKNKDNAISNDMEKDYYLFIYKDRNDKLKAVYNNIVTFLSIYDSSYSSEDYGCYNIDLKQMTFEKKPITFDNQEIFNKLYSLTEEDRITNEDIKKVGNDIVIYNKKKQKKIENILKKVDYDFHK